MSTGLIVQGALANFEGRISEDEVDRTLGSLPHVTMYRHAPIPGTISASAFDWMLLLEVGGGVASVASALYLLFEKAIRSKPERKADSFLLIQLKHPNGTFRQITLKIGAQTHESFIADFERAVLEVLSTESAISAEQLQKEIDESGGWIKISKYDF